MMQLQKIQFTIEGNAPGLLLHNGQLVDPMNPIAKQMKSISSKRTKTDEDHKLMSKLEWIGGIYSTETPQVYIENGDIVVEGGGAVCLPGEGIQAAIISAGKKHRLGTALKSAMVCEETNCLLQFPNSGKSLNDLLRMPQHVSRLKADVQKVSIMRTRPWFPEWSVTFTLSYMPDIIDRQALIDVVELCGAIIGMFDYRPRYGRFTVKSCIDLS